MGPILMLPGFLLNLNLHFGPLKTLLTLAYGIALQVFIGTEFLIHDWRAYVSRSYDFSKKID